jgi:hypothetical protein
MDCRWSHSGSASVSSGSWRCSGPGVLPTAGGWSTGSGVAYRIWCEGEPAGEVAGDVVALRDWAARHVDGAGLITVAEGEDPFYE